MCAVSRVYNVCVRFRLLLQFFVSAFIFCLTRSFALTRFGIGLSLERSFSLFLFSAYIFYPIPIILLTMHTHWQYRQSRVNSVKRSRSRCISIAYNLYRFVAIWWQSKPSRRRIESMPMYDDFRRDYGLVNTIGLMPSAASWTHSWTGSDTPI